MVNGEQEIRIFAPLFSLHNSKLIISSTWLHVETDSTRKNGREIRTRIRTHQDMEVDGDFQKVVVTSKYPSCIENLGTVEEVSARSVQRY